MGFKTQKQDGRARAGEFETPHGKVLTPVFMPVGTQASVKALSSNDLEDLDTQIILSNTYHLYLRPGADLIEKLGGLHKFMNWDKPILTDSGGFQVMSLGKELVKVDEEGVTFRSHLDGSLHRFTPKSAIKVQHQLGADIIMAFDEAIADNLDKEYIQMSMERTHRWAKQSLDAHQKLGGKQLLFGIVQGGIHKDLKRQSTKAIAGMGFDGIAFGGEAIGFNNQATKQILEWVEDLVPKDIPHYAMGVGEVETIFICIEGGVDMFDCVSPSRRARNGSLYISPKNGGNRKNMFALNITNAKYKLDKKAIDPGCLCFTCQNHTRAYLRHLYMSKELTYHRLATIHNIHFMVNLVNQIREAILNTQFQKFKKGWIK